MNTSENISLLVTMSPQINELAAALAKAQGEIQGASKDSANPFFKSKYADLAAVWDACRQPLSKNNICVMQPTSYTEKGIAVVTTLAHGSGQWMQGILPICAEKQNPQGIGSAITYARRYSLAGMVGIYQVDDDAESAMHRDSGSTQAPVHSDLVPRYGNYELQIAWGSYKNKKFREIPPIELIKLSKWLSETSDRKSNFADLATKVSLFLEDLQKMELGQGKVKSEGPRR